MLINSMRLLLSSLLFIGGVITNGFGQTANFTADIISGCAPLTVKFTDSSTGGANGWDWTFGNGNSSSLQNPSAIYTQPGIYNVTLAITTGSGNDTEIKTGFITVFAKPDVDFVADVTEGCAPLAVQFTDLTDPISGSIQSWEWIFGDGNSSSDQNPSHVFTQNGQHNITLLVNNSDGCQTVRTKVAYIDARKPSTFFTASSTEFCSVPANVSFTNQSTGKAPLNYLWDFGDGNTSNAESPNHAYTDSGIFSASLTTEDADGCPSTHTILINVLEQLEAEVLLSSTKLCVGDSLFVEDVTSGDVLSRLWDFGDGNVSTLVSQGLVYNSPGIYPINLTLQMADGCVAQQIEEVEVVALPVPDFSVHFSCDFVAEFTNLSSDSEQWLWDFGNGNTSTQEHPTFIFPNKGTYSVKLTAISDFGCETISSRNIVVPGNPVALFKPNDKSVCSEDAVLEGCAPFLVAFENTTVSSRFFSSKWHFGDGDSSSLHSPTHIFTQEGTYTVRLEITDTEGCKSIYTSVAHVGGSSPQSDVEISSFSVCVGDEIEIGDNLNEADFWCWNLGDEQFKTGQNIVHSYGAPGLYTITLTARKSGCGVPFVVQTQIEVKRPLVDFEVVKDCNEINSFSFINSEVVAFPEETWVWDFGDNQSSNELSPVHQYSQEGTYTVSLNGSNSSTGCSNTKEIEVMAFEVIADAEVNQTVICKGVDLAFTNKSQHASTYRWEMGDGTVYTTKDISHSYAAAGQYEVRMFARDQYVCSELHTLNITVVDIEGKFSHEQSSDCNIAEVAFTDLSQSDNGVVSWLWDFGDGNTSNEQNPTHQYTDQGTFDVTLSLTDGMGAQCTVIKEEIIVFSVPVVDFIVNKKKACPEELLHFTNLSVNATHFEWNLGNGQTSTDQNAEAQYSEPGIYNISLKVSDDWGCVKEMVKNAEVEISRPEAAFNASKVSAECPPLITDFSDISEGDIQAWSWSFGDGNHSTLASPTHAFLTAGNYQVSLTVTDATGCEHTQALEQLIVVGGPNGNLNLDTETCLSDSTTFSSESINTIKHFWDFGDGTVLETTENSIRYKYEKKGEYNPALVLEDANGCQVAIESSSPLTVNPIPFNNLFLSEAYPFLGDVVHLKSLISFGGFQQIWYVNGELLGEGYTSSFTPSAIGKYTISLHTVDDKGCSLILSKELVVQDDIDFIPNIFTPNGDGFNPTFSIEGLEGGLWALKVFNRWGRVVYESSPYQGNWNGRDVHNGVYYFQLQNIYRPEKMYRGSVQVLR